ncbi:MAG: hypothetical protein JWN14_5150, partial [Chthonomonadales bacterium]|nr:hypothetical protein [Chthonomonadales bacterium]
MLTRSLRTLFALLLLCICIAPSAIAQELNVLVMKGGQEQDPDVGDVKFESPFGIGFDAKGNYYTVMMD